MDITAKFITDDEQTQTVTVVSGTTLMQAAVQNSVPGIEAECGGACACATCHVYIEPAWLSKLPPKGDAELGMLEFAVNVQENSRLGCQITLTEALDQITVRVPRTQH